MYQALMKKNAANLRVIIPMTGTEEKRIAELSPDVVELENSDSEEPEIIEEVKAKEPTESEKIAETRKEESEVVEDFGTYYPNGDFNSFRTATFSCYFRSEFC